MMSPRLEPGQIWPTPVLAIYYDVDDLNRGLARIITEMEQRITSTGTATAVAGLEEGLTTHWMEYNVLNWDYPECRTLRQMVLDGARSYFELMGDPDEPRFRICGISCWANILRFGQSLAIHHHDPGFASAHYCVQSGREKGAEPAVSDSGQTRYFRPGFVERSMGGDQAGPTSPWDNDWLLSENPTEGRLFFFPSYVRHEVRPNLESAPRITIAMDFYIAGQASSKMLHFVPPRWFVPDAAGAGETRPVRSRAEVLRQRQSSPGDH
ncbi:MAG TPA: putative 2OG-Fe(II) oxygenase [Pyrinomonadaceae bacterium]|nr:putative 2OG-Fe(II) oxygenase [Pyrinomonadaceae bacterium]